MNLFSKMADLWGQREPRERVLLGALSVIVVVVALYMLLYRPFALGHDEALQRFNSVEEDYRWLQTQVASIRRLQSVVPGATLAGIGPDKIRERLKASLDKGGLRGNVEIVDEEEGGQFIEIRIEPASGAGIMRWIAARIADGHLLHRLRTETSGPDQVSATVQFEV